MREIREVLYRGKSSTMDRWYKGSYLYEPEYRDYDINSEGVVVELPLRHRHRIIIDGRESREIDPKTIGEYTGFTEMNEGKKKIFEDDIIRATRFEDPEHEHNFVIDFHNGCFMATILTKFTDEEAGSQMPYYHLSELENMRVIGNIHDNPELMEG